MAEEQEKKEAKEEKKKEIVEEAKKEDKAEEKQAETKEEEKVEEEIAEETEELEKEIPELKDVVDEEKVEEKIEEAKEEKKKEAVEEAKKEDKAEEKQEQEDEILEMMKEDEEEKKAKEEAKEEEPEEEKDIGEELSLIKVKTRKPKQKKKEGKPAEKKEEPKKKEAKEEEKKEELTEDSPESKIYALRTTANREDQVMDFVTSNAARKKLEVYSIIRPHGMRGYIFLEAGSRSDAEQAAFGVPYARGLLPNIIQYKEIEHMLEQVKKEMNIQKNDIAEIISGPFKREKCKITRIDRTKEEVVVELLEAAVPIPITVKMDAVRVIRRETDEEEK